MGGGGKKYSYPPGPVGLPFFGNIFQLGSGAPFLKHKEFTEIYGDIHTVAMFGRKTVVLSSMNAVRDCNFDHSDDFNDIDW